MSERETSVPWRFCFRMCRLRWGVGESWSREYERADGDENNSQARLRAGI